MLLLICAFSLARLGAKPNAQMRSWNVIVFTQGGGLAALPWAICVPSFQNSGRLRRARDAHLQRLARLLDERIVGATGQDRKLPHSVCSGCGGTDLRTPGQTEPPREPLTRRQRFGWFFIKLGITVLLSSILCGASVPYDPELGEGNSRAIAAQFGAVAAFFQVSPLPVLACT
jgi:hypothetical protein